MDFLLHARRYTARYYLHIYLSPEIFPEGCNGEKDLAPDFKKLLDMKTDHLKYDRLKDFATGAK